MHYRHDIDDAIFEKLAQSISGVPSGQLKSSVECAIRKADISPDVFYHHIKQLKRQGAISANDQGRGKVVVYSLTPKARRKRELQILATDAKAEVRRRLLIVMFNHLGNAVEPERFEIDKAQPLQYFAKVITEMETLLKKERKALWKKIKSAKVNGFEGFEKDLFIKRGSMLKPPDNFEGQYDDREVSRSPEELKQFFDKINEVFANPALLKKSTSGKIDVRVKIEERHCRLDVATLTQEIYFYYRDSKVTTQYYYTTVGFSSRQLEKSLHSSDDGQSFVDISHEDIENAVQDLRRQGYITMAGILGDETIYKFADEQLIRLLDDLRWTSDRRAEYLLYKHKYSYDWSMEDQNWLELYYGEEQASQLVRQAELSGFRYRKTTKKALSTSYVKPNNDQPHALVSEEDFQQTLNSSRSALQEAIDALKNGHEETIKRYAFLEQILIPLCPELSGIT